jgi:hypothetical protein
VITQLLGGWQPMRGIRRWKVDKMFTCARKKI